MTELSDNGPVGLRQCMVRKSLLFHDLPKVSCLMEFGMVESTTRPVSINARNYSSVGAALHESRLP